MYRLRLVLAHHLNRVTNRVAKLVANRVQRMIASDGFVDRFFERIDFDDLAQNIGSNLNERRIGESIDAGDIGREIDVDNIHVEYEIDSSDLREAVQEAVAEALKGQEVTITL